MKKARYFLLGFVQLDIVAIYMLLAFSTVRPVEFTLVLSIYRVYQGFGRA